MRAGTSGGRVCVWCAAVRTVHGCRRCVQFDKLRRTALDDMQPLRARFTRSGSDRETTSVGAGCEVYRRWSRAPISETSQILRVRRMRAVARRVPVLIGNGFLLTERPFCADTRAGMAHAHWLMTWFNVNGTRQNSPRSSWPSNPEARVDWKKRQILFGKKS